MTIIPQEFAFIFLPEPQHPVRAPPGLFKHARVDPGVLAGNDLDF